MNDKTKPQNFATAIKGALAKKHAAHHPDAKKAGSKAAKPGAGNAPKDLLYAKQPAEVANGKRFCKV